MYTVGHEQSHIANKALKVV